MPGVGTHVTPMWWSTRSSPWPKARPFRLGRKEAVIQFVTADDRANSRALTGRPAALYKELICKGAACNGETSGGSVFKQPVDPNDPKSGYKEGGMDAKAYHVTGIDTRIRYDSSRNPPFTVMTSMPYKP